MSFSLIFTSNPFICLFKCGNKTGIVQVENTVYLFLPVKLIFIICQCFSNLVNDGNYWTGYHTKSTTRTLPTAL